MATTRTGRRGTIRRSPSPREAPMTRPLAAAAALVAIAVAVTALAADPQPPPATPAAGTTRSAPAGTPRTRTVHLRLGAGPGHRPVAIELIELPAGEVAFTDATGR